MNVFEQAKQEGVSMREKGRRGGVNAGKAARRKAELRKAFEEVKTKGGDYWNR